MEATNISIKQTDNVSINIEKFVAMMQRAWQIIKRYCNMGAWSLVPIFRAIDAHPTLSNIWIAAWAIAFIYLIFMYA